MICDTKMIKTCNTCLENDDVTGCKLSNSSLCVYNGFSNWRMGKRLFFCERCKTNSVVIQMAGHHLVPQEPRISVWCLKCDDYPIVEGEIYSGHKVEGIEFKKGR